MFCHKRSSQRWGKTDKVIDDWLTERQELLVLYYRLLKIQPFDEELSDTNAETLPRFCQILIDYVSAGHFEVFEKIAQASALANSQYLGLDRELLVQILRTTIVAMDFSNKHSDKDSLPNLMHDLSQLGEALARRMDLEDQLIQSYLDATSEMESVKKSKAI